MGWMILSCLLWYSLEKFIKLGGQLVEKVGYNSWEEKRFRRNGERFSINLVSKLGIVIPDVDIEE